MKVDFGRSVRTATWVLGLCVGVIGAMGCAGGDKPEAADPVVPAADMDADAAMDAVPADSAVDAAAPVKQTKSNKNKNKQKKKKKKNNNKKKKK